MSEPLALDELEDVWLPLIESTALPRCHVLLVGTKADVGPPRVRAEDVQQLRARWARRLGVAVDAILTSSKSGEGVDAVFARVADEFERCGRGAQFGSRDGTILTAADNEGRPGVGCQC